MYNPIEERKRLVQERIEKSFNDGLSVSEEIEKGRHGIYEDNAENRRKNRVGQEYGHAAQQKELSGKQNGAAKPDEKESISNQAAWASDDALKRAAADEKAKPEVREAAKKELAKREAHQKELAKHGGDNKSGKTASDARKDEILKKLKQNTVESKEARKAKSSRLKSILEDGTNKDDSIFMSKNESYFKDVLKKHGFDSFDDFEDWGAEGADGDWDKYEKIFKTCFNKIPADKFSETKKSSGINESHGEKLIDNALQQMGYESGRKFEDRSVYAKQLSDWVNEFASKNDKTPSEMYDWLDDNMETLYNLDEMDMDELDEYSNFEGWDELNDIINEMSDAFENPDKEEADFEKTFLGALKSDMGELDNSRKGKAAQKKLVELARDFANKNPDLNLTIEDWQDIIGGDVDESDEKYGKLKGFRKLSNALERFYDSLD